MRTRFLFVIVVCLLAGTGVARAADCTWNGRSGTNTLWSNPANWADCNNGVPHAGDTATFPDDAISPDNHFDLPADSPAVVTIVGRGLDNNAWRIHVDTTLFLKSLTVTSSPPDRLNLGPSLLGRIQLTDQATVTTHPDSIGVTTFTFGNPGLDIDLHGHTLTFNTESPVNVIGSISGNC